MDAERAPGSSAPSTTAPGHGPHRLTVAARALGLLTCEGLSLGLAGWTLRAGARLQPYVAANDLPPLGRRYVLLSMALGALVMMTVGGFLWWRRGLGATNRLALRGAPLCLVGLVAPLFFPRIWTEGDLPFLVLTSVVVLCAQRLVRLAMDAGSVSSPLVPAPRLAVPEPLRRLLRDERSPLALALAGALIYSIYFSIITIDNHYRLGTASFDLGIENNLVWNAIHGGPLFKTSPLGGPTSTHLGYHQTYFSYVIGLVYWMAPRPETLLVIQAALLGGAALPLYGVARPRIGPWPALAVVVLFLLYPPLHGSNLYDFHYLPFAPFFLWLTLYCVDRRRPLWTTLAVLLALSVREDISALLAVLGVILVVTGERPRAGAVLTVVGAIYFVALKMIIMPRFLHGHSSYVHQYQDLLPAGDSGFAGVLKTVFANPVYTLKTLLLQEKLEYLLLIIAPLAFLPWRRPVGLLCSVPGFFFTLLSTRYPPLVKISFQYTAYWTPFLFLAVVFNLRWLALQESGGRLQRGTRRAWLAAAFLGALLTTHQYGAFARNNVWGGFSRFGFGVTDADRARHDALYELIALVPKDAKIVSSELIVPHVSSRKDAYTLRTGLFDAEYLLFWSPPRGDEATFVAQALRSGEFGVVAEKGPFVLARRGHSTATNAALLRRIGL